MRRNLNVLVDVDALDVLPSSGKKRAAVIGFIRGLVDNGYLKGDFQVRDPETDRSFEVSSVAGYAVTWWLDAAVGEVKVVDIRAVT